MSSKNHNVPDALLDSLLANYQQSSGSASLRQSGMTSICRLVSPGDATGLG